MLRTIAAYALRVLSVALLVSGALAPAQTVQGVVTGTVFDPSGAVLPNAELTLTNVNTNISQKERSGSDGSFRFSLVPPGSYELAAKLSGFADKQIKGIAVEASSTTPVNVTLSVSSSTTTVEVEAQEALVQTATADLAHNVNATTIENIPLLTRNVFDLAFLAPAVTQGMNLNPASGGARESGTGYLLNGADNNDNFSEGGINVTPPLESVGEFTVLTNNMSAQYGRAGGAVVSALQKSGGNSFHGVVYEFNRNASFNASDFFQNRQGSPKPKYIRNQFGGEIDGPIVKNRTFFAFAYDQIELRTGSEMDIQVPTAAELQRIRNGAGKLAQFYLQKYPLKTSDNPCPDQAANAPESIGHIGCLHVFDPVNTPTKSYFGRLDHQFSTANRITATLNFNRTPQIDLYGGGHPFASPISAANTNNYHHLALVDTHVFNPAVVNEFTVGHNRHLSTSLASINGDTNINDPEVAIDGQDYGSMGFGLGPYEGFNSSFTQDRWLLQDNLSWIRGKHTFRFGGNWQFGNLYRNWDLGGPGYYEFGNVLGQSAADLGYLNANGSISGNVDTGQSNFQKDFPYFQELSIDPQSGAKANAYRHYLMKDAGLFVQDDWKMTPRLTLNLGLRWERYGAPTEMNGIIAQFTNLTCLSIQCIKNARTGPVPSMWKTNNKDFAPRFGFAWDVFGNGRTSLRGGYGISFDRIFDNVWSNGAWNPPFYGLLDLDASAGDTIYYNAPGSIAPGAYTPGSLPGPAGRVSVRTMDVAMKDTSVQNFYLGVEKQLLGNFLVRVNYQGSLGRHLPVLMNLNRYDGMRYNPTFADARPNSLYTGFNYRANNLTSSYNALVTEVQKRYSNGLQFQFSYTWSKLMDYGSDLFTGETTQGSYSQPYYFVSNNAQQLERGPGAFDHAHNYKVMFVYELPFMRAQGNLVGKVLGGWQFSSFYQGYSGHPLMIYNGRTRFRGNVKDANGVPENLGGDYNLDGVANDRVSFVGPSIAAAYSGFSPADGIFIDNSRIGCGFAGARSTNIAACNTQFGVAKPSALFVNPPGTGVRFGSLGRNVFRGPWFNGLNSSLVKNIRMRGEAVKVQFRAEAFNILNHPNFDGIVTDVNSAQFGRAQLLVGDAIARRLQLGLRVAF